VRSRREYPDRMEASCLRTRGGSMDGWDAVR
jgi:hypothetical protein